MCNKPIYKLWQATAQYKVHSHIHVRLYAFNDVYSAHLLYNRNVTLRVPVFYILLVTLFATEKIVFEVIMSDTNVSTRAHVYTRAHIRTYTHTHTHTHTHTKQGFFIIIKQPRTADRSYLAIMYILRQSGQLAQNISKIRSTIGKIDVNEKIRAFNA